MSSPSTILKLCPPFRAEHVGSLVRPKVLYEKRQQLEQGNCTLADVRALEDDAVRHVVQVQKDLGMQTITDGEMRR